MAKPLPIPQYRGRRPRIVPERHPDAFNQVLSELYYAEKSAFAFFGFLADPTRVQSSDIFLKARSVLMRDEESHMRDFQRIARMLGAHDIPPPSRESQGLWRVDRWLDEAVFPLKATVAALTVLFCEGLGFAFLHNIAGACVPGEIRDVLLANIEDEKAHLRISMHVLKVAIEADDVEFAGDALLAAAHFILVARGAARAQRSVLEQLGFDYFEVTRSSVEFLYRLLIQVLDEANYPLSRWERRSLDAMVAQIATTGAMKSAYYLSYLPEPVWARPMFRYLWQYRLWRSTLSHEQASRR